MSVSPLARTLDQELLALLRGASFECPVCGEFLMRFPGALACPECRLILAESAEIPALDFPAAARTVTS